ncbi:PBSX family phage terminase large subunit [Faecalispora jeddahensis]|uniref:PBSX family phage terminase large subunit n=1 Tax=Faecalispora jeddahensis TaxID=1414721 RepID=UPI0004AC7321|nr:PBSX family phage terminase large subunit [Faecalispora jeddahensis]
MNKVYTPKQLSLLRLWQQNKLRRINLLEGSVRSGKTWISLVMWAFWVATMPKDGNYLMVAKTLTSLRRNCLDLLQELVGTKHFTYSLSKKEGRLFGRLIYLEGVNDARAESKIRGMTLQGAYCDELTLFTEDFFSMLLSRLSCPGAKLIATTNPDSPMHWLKAKYMDRASELNMLILKFLIDDNTFLDQEYVENLKKEYVGVFYDRFIRGLWVVAEGLIYADVANGQGIVEPENRQYVKRYISIDYGTLNPFSAGLYGLCKGVWYRYDEYYYSGREEQRQLTDSEYYAELEKLAGKQHVEAVVIDPSAASMIAEIKKHGRFRVIKANNEVVDGIRETAKAFSRGQLKVTRNCSGAITEFSSYRWDDKKQEDKPIKENDHAMDEIRYFVNTVMVKRGGVKIGGW